MGGQGSRFGVCSGYLLFGPICTTIGTAHEGAALEETPEQTAGGRLWSRLLDGMAQGAALEETTDAALQAYSRIRRLLAFRESAACADLKIGDAALLRNAQGRKSAPRRRGPASILDIDGAGATGRWRGFAREREGARKA